jgi:hypothetical protein
MNNLKRETQKERRELVCPLSFLSSLLSAALSLFSDMAGLSLSLSSPFVCVTDRSVAKHIV